MDEPFDPQKITLGDIIIFRRTVTVPDDEPVVIEGPSFDYEPSRYLNSTSHVAVDPDDPSVIHLVGVLSVTPASAIAWQEQKITEARARAMESILEEEDDTE